MVAHSIFRTELSLKFISFLLEGCMQSKSHAHSTSVSLKAIILLVFLLPLQPVNKEADAKLP
jgi:hypothetical protein